MPSHLESAIKEKDVQKVHGLLTGEGPIAVNILNKQSETGVIIACKHNALNVLTLLAQKSKVDLNARDSKGFCALHHAAQLNHSECVEELLRHNSLQWDMKSSRDGDTALHVAVLFGSLDSVKLLLKKDTNLKTVENSDGLRPVHLACVRGDQEITRILISPSDLFSIWNKANASLLHLAVTGIEHPWFSGFQSDLMADASLSPSFDKGSRVDFVTFVLGLCTEDAESHLLLWVDCIGDTALMWAITMGDFPVVELLLQQKKELANIQNNNKETVLHIAALFNQEQIMNNLLSNCEVDVNAKDVRGETPLHWAAWRGHLGIVKTLIQFGARIDIQNNDGMTPKGEAQIWKQLQIIEFFDSISPKDN